jgi:hypothetical protein
VALVFVLCNALALPDALDKRVRPVIALICGIGWNWLLLAFLQAADARPATIILYGLLSGFAASGIWSGARNAVVEPMQAAAAAKVQVAPMPPPPQG